MTNANVANLVNRRGRKQSLLQPSLVGVIDEGTNSVAFSIYTTPDFLEVATHKLEIKLYRPHDGWVEQDPRQIMEAVRECTEIACAKLPSNYSKKDIVTIGLTNQRETTIVWDRITGEPFYNAIVWNDIRTTSTVDKILAKLPDQNKNHFKTISGLPVSPYFSALKIHWLMENIPGVRRACNEHRCLAGTIDSWIIWNLTRGELHITDVTNASRTLLMNIETLHWDPMLLKTFSIPNEMLPEIRSCSEIYGKISDGSVLNGVNISGIVGNQQASMLGQMCFKPGQAKNTYRSGCFLLCNTGEKHVISSHGLLTTVAYKLGKNAPVIYALEGAVAIAGQALNWLHKNIRLLPDTADCERLAENVSTTGDVYFVPAFTGLYAPYWRKDARGIICGLTQYTTKNHIIRATLEAICFQTRDILECMHEECGHNLNKLHTDGILTSNNLLMQLQADIAGIPVFRSQLIDTTAFGAAMCAAQAAGINACELIPEKRYYDNFFYDTFLPTTTDEERHIRCTKWKKAVERSFGWVVQKRSIKMTDERYQLLSSIPAGLYLITVFAMLVHSTMQSK